MNWFMQNPEVSAFLLYAVVLPALSAALKYGADAADKRWKLGNGLASFVLDYGKLQWLAQKISKLPPPEAK